MPEVQQLPRPGYDGAPVDPRHRLMEVRQFANGTERDLMGHQNQFGWPHIAPRSTLVAVIGNHYKFGSWGKIADMVAHTNQAGVKCGLSEIQDRCFQPYDALGTMRNEATLKAINEGWEYLMMVDADVFPEPDTLMRLLNLELPITAPYVVEEGTGRKLHGPHWDPDSGIHPLKWCVLSMLLFHRNVFNALPDPSGLWSDAIGADEGFHFQRLWRVGHRPYLDTGNQVTVAGRPHYPLATLRFKKEDYDRYWWGIQQSRMAPPDRRPLKPDSDLIDNLGEYNPFLPPRQAPSAETDLIYAQATVASDAVVAVPASMTNAPVVTPAETPAPAPAVEEPAHG